jgi:hypothetical protein
MTRQSPVVMLEFNELCPRLIERFMREGRLPQFEGLYGESQVYTTTAGEKPPYLEPWIQWVTIHSGLDFADHGIAFLGDGHHLQQKCIWDSLSDEGFRVWVCGSLNVRYDLPLNGSVLPDPWTATPPPFPDDLASYFAFVQANVVEHANHRPSTGTRDYLRYLRFLAFMASHGLSADSISAIAKQLLSERGGSNRFKRVAVLDKLHFDVFSAVYRKLRPDFSTFFLNSTAHLQHRYWREFEPEAFARKPTPEDQREFGTAIPFGYEQMDQLVGRVRRLVGEDATIILCSALSQQPCLKYDEPGGKVSYRPRNFEQLMAFAGVTATHTIAPAMSKAFQIAAAFENTTDATEAQRVLRGVQIQRRDLLFVQQVDKVLHLATQVDDDLPADAVVRSGDSRRVSRFSDLFHRFEDKKSGMHHADGVLWIRRRDARHRVHAEPVPLTSIAPTILRLFGTPRPAFMRGEALPLESPDVRGAAA